MKNWYAARFSIEDGRIIKSEAPVKNIWGSEDGFFESKYAAKAACEKDADQVLIWHQNPDGSYDASVVTAKGCEKSYHIMYVKH
jgi:hypothetical protein